MKNSIKKSTTKKVGFVLAILFFLFAASPRSFANTGKQPGALDNYSIKYVGSSENGIVFHVRYDNPDATKFDLVLKNQDGITMFQRSYSDKEFDRDIVLPKDIELNKLSVIVKTTKGDIAKDFKIQTKTVEIVDVQASN
ncbi:MAG: hypothetical protein JST09_14185 [Bacteroidetes bacterium]|nr:hypothetical protein [Bacteroidota bacterium]